MSKRFQLLHIIVVVSTLFFLNFTKAFAKIELSYIAPPAELKTTESFTIDVTLSGVDEKAEYFIRGVFYKPESIQYFGLTQNGQGNWQSDANAFTQFYKVVGNGTHQVAFKADTSSSFFTPNTNYFFKIGRYTPGGSLSWSEQAPSIVLIKSETHLPTVTLTPTPNFTATPTPSPTQTSIDQNSIQLSEIVACPSDDQGEWVELFNKTGETITLQNWKLKDSTDTHSVDINNSIAPFNYVVIRITSSILNNSGDSVRLFSDQNLLIDQMSYSNCQAGTSYISVNGSWQSTQQVTQGNANVFISVATLTPSPVTDQKTTQEDDEIIESSSSAQKSLEELPTEFVNEDVQIASISSVDNSMDDSVSESTEEAHVTSTTNDKPRSSFMNSSTAFLLAGCSYVLSAAMFAQKWYNLTSYVLTSVSPPS